MTIRFFMIITFIMALSNASAQQSTDGNPYLNQMPQWQKVLEQYVDEEGRVDFINLSKNTTELDAFVDAIALVSPAITLSFLIHKVKCWRITLMPITH